MDDDLKELITEVLEECERRGLCLPFILCGISPNGSIISVRLTGEGSAQILAEHFEGEGFALPMTIVVVDRDNEAARVTVTASGRTWH
jgi:hypothetical protein